MQLQVEFFNEKKPDAKAMPASTTKMMTCILGLENANDDDIVEVDKRAVGVEGSAIYINEGDKIKNVRTVASYNARFW